MTMERCEKTAPAPVETTDSGEIGELSEEDKASIYAAIDAAVSKPAQDDLARLNAELGPQFDAWVREQETIRFRERSTDQDDHAEPQAD